MENEKTASAQVGSVDNPDAQAHRLVGGGGNQGLEARRILPKMGRTSSIWGAHG